MELKRTILLTIGVGAFVALAAVAGTKRAMPGLHFGGVDVPKSAEDRSRALAAGWARWQGRRFPLRFEAFAHAGDVRPDGPFGQGLDHTGAPILNEDGTPWVCNDLDGATLLQAHGALWSVVHGECRPGVLELSRVEQDEDGGLAYAEGSTLDLSHLGGGSVYCAAEDTAWSSHLAAEEYEVNARTLRPDGTDPADHQGYNDQARYWGGSLAEASPYTHGWIQEVQLLDGGGASLISRRTSLGRFSHELAKVLPDGRTVYLSDDGRNGGLFLFVADVAGDLSVGQLYAAQVQPGPEGSLGAVGWINLGRASEAQLAPWLARKTSFDEVLEAAELEGDACPEGFTSVNTSWKRECLRVPEGGDLVASRLETRRYAAIRGATTEFSKAEGLAFDPGGKRLFLALARVEKGMTPADETWDDGGPDHLQWAKNPCGAVVSMPLAPADDLDGAPIDSPFVATRIDLLLEGAEKTYTGALAHNTCDLDAIAGPDNLEFIPEAGVLLVAEDTSGHDNNALWAYDLERGSLTRVLTVPLGGEVAGLNWYPDVGGFGYITVSVQKPFSTWGDPWWVGEIEGDTRSWTGWLGPFPQLNP